MEKPLIPLTKDKIIKCSFILSKDKMPKSLFIKFGTFCRQNNVKVSVILDVMGNPSLSWSFNAKTLKDNDHKEFPIQKKINLPQDTSATIRIQCYASDQRNAITVFYDDDDQNTIIVGSERQIGMLVFDFDFDFLDEFKSRPEFLLHQNNQFVIKNSKLKNNIIIKRKGALGDVIMMTPAIRELRLKNPDMYIGIETWFPDVFKNSPYVNEVSNHITKTNQKVIDLDGCYEKNFDRHPIDVYAESLLGSSKLLSKSTELFSTEKDKEWVDSWWESNIFKYHKNKDKKIIVVHFGTTWTPIDNCEFEKLLDFLRKEFITILVGRKIPDKEYYPQNMNNIIDLVDKEWSIHKLQWLIEKADIFFGTDTGIMHIASTTNTPIVCCYSFINPKFRESHRDCIEFRAVTPSENSCRTLYCAEINKKMSSDGEFCGINCPNSFSCAKSIKAKDMIKEIQNTNIPFVE